MRYSDAGVDIDAAARAKRRIRELARGTFNRRVLGDLGAFGGFFALDGLPRDAVLVSSLDGVGTKLKIAFATGRHSTVGADLVNHCVNDIAVHGARPLFFLDYLAAGRLEPEVAAEVVAGVARACRATGCALVGGETAEMPGFYAEGEYDLAGSIVGWVGRREILDGRAIRPGDAILGLASAGLHTNGYSLARKVLLERAGLRLDRPAPGFKRTLGEELLAPHRGYLRVIDSLLRPDDDHAREVAKGRPGGRRRAPASAVHGLVHITGGGLTDNPPRILPPGCQVQIRLGTWPVPPIFSLIARLGRVPERDMLRTFNMGVGLMLIVAESALDQITAALGRQRERFWVIGRIVKGARGVRYVP